MTLVEVLQAIFYVIMIIMGTTTWWLLCVQPLIDRRWRPPRLDLRPGRKLRMQGETFVVTSYEVTKYHIRFDCDRLEQVEKLNRIKCAEAKEDDNG